MRDINWHRFERAFETVGRLIAQYHHGIEVRRVAPPLDQAQTDRLLDRTIGETGVGLPEVIADLSAMVLPNSMTTSHPCYFGLVNSSPLPASFLVEPLVACLNNNAASGQQAPTGLAAEHEVTRAVGEVMGLGPTWTGGFVGGGAFANLEGLLMARTRDAGRVQERGSVPQRFSARVYVSEAVHFSVPRAARVLGLAEDAVFVLPATGRGILDPGQLAERIRLDRRSGKHPMAVVATVGTTGTGAIDPLDAIADVCRSEGVWLHVDACYGGGAFLIDDLRNRLEGIESADSIAIDLHKWFFVPITASLLFTRHPEIRKAAFEVDTSYLPRVSPPDPYQTGIAVSRRAIALTAWAILRAHGLAEVRAAVQRNITLARALENQLQECKFRVLPGGQLSTVCARWEVSGISPASSDLLQSAIAAEVVESGRAWFSTARHADQAWLRFSILNLYTRSRHVGFVVRTVADAARSRSAGSIVVPGGHGSPPHLGGA